jgi:chromosome segregation ATPase
VRAACPRPPHRLPRTPPPTQIDQASLKLKTQKEQIDILQQQLKEAEIAKITYKDVKSESAHLEKRLNQKADEISILRETVKTLYQDNERISGEKEALAKEVASLKDGSSALRKKLKKQEDEISNHRNELKKLTLSTEDRFAEYLKEDEQKQGTLPPT